MSKYFLVVKFDEMADLPQIREIAEEFVDFPFVEAVRIHQVLPEDNKQRMLFGEKSITT